MAWSPIQTVNCALKFSPNSSIISPSFYNVVYGVNSDLAATSHYFNVKKNTQAMVNKGGLSWNNSTWKDSKPKPTYAYFRDDWDWRDDRKRAVRVRVE